MPIGKKTAESATEALNQAKTSRMEIDALREQLERQRQVTRAVWELLKQRTGITDDELFAALGRIKAAADEESQKAVPCPKCGRSLQQHSVACIYCGETVERRDLFLC